MNDPSAEIMLHQDSLTASSCSHADDAHARLPIKPRVLLLHERSYVCRKQAG